ncbi:Uncharacterised protein [Shigella sonnei]|nr:Uncharacterised protein [Shigella sonnei]CSE50304.1 Uncharacterised protein [Shigella sonnei]CSE92637.1 Uncharacterised protein [Shigella sonnei]CSF14420.1 Uncharacterised protein [Shigella sonnei]CSF61457.1 Uncharacterised protein [Shigella sonnei]
MFDRRGENHHSFTLFGELHNLADDVRGNTLLFFQLTVEIGFAEQPVALCLQAAEIILHYWHIQSFWRRQIAVFNHITQGQLINAVTEKGFLIAAYHAVIMELVDPTFAQSKRRGSQPQQA